MNAESGQMNDQMELIRASVTLSNALTILGTVITQMATLAQEAQDIMLLDDLMGAETAAIRQGNATSAHPWN